MISIFYKPTFLSTNPHSPYVHEGEKPLRGHLMRVSSMIRGDQIADQIGAKYNPEDGYENDVCIYVKPHIKKDNVDFNFEGKKAYIDIIDGHNLGQLMVKYPEVGVIVCSQADMETLTGVIPNEIVCIPQHHCNFERKTRTRDEVTRVGVIGTSGAFDFLPDGIHDELKKRNMELVTFSKFFTRQDVIDFYMSIDVQMVWRPYKKILSNPLKLVNAASFGIPTIALDEVAFHELQGHYIPIKDKEEFLYKLDEIRNNKDMYTYYSEKCINIAEEKYHIEKVSEMYKALDK